MEDIRENGRILDDAIQKVSTEAIKGELFPENTIILSTSATIGEHALIQVPFLANQRFTALILNEKYKELINDKYLYYYCFKLSKWCEENVSKSSFASVDMQGLRKQRIPLPPLAEQQRIVNVLDKFDTLVHSLSEGLPKEIEQRQQQYEYYRDKLLDFETYTL